MRVLQSSEGYSENKTMTEVDTKPMKENEIGRSQSIGKTIRKAKIALGDRYNQMTRPELRLFILKLAFQRK